MIASCSDLHVRGGRNQCYVFRGSSHRQSRLRWLVCVRALLCLASCAGPPISSLARAVTPQYLRHLWLPCCQQYILHTTPMPALTSHLTASIPAFVLCPQHTTALRARTTISWHTRDCHTRNLAGEPADSLLEWHSTPRRVLCDEIDLAAHDVYKQVVICLYHDLLEPPLHLMPRSLVCDVVA
jgi:hypothetical protein